MKNNHYQKHKERLRKEVREKYQNLSEEKKGKKSPDKDIQNFTEKEKEKKCQYHRELNKNLSKEQKQKLVEYRRNYYITHNK